MCSLLHNRSNVSPVCSPAVRRYLCEMLCRHLPEEHILLVPSFCTIGTAHGFVLQNFVTGRYFGGRRNTLEYKALLRSVRDFAGSEKCKLLAPAPGRHPARQAGSPSQSMPL